MAFAKYFELGEIAPTMGKLASASPINILRLMGSYRRDTFAPARHRQLSIFAERTLQNDAICLNWRPASEPGLLPLGGAEIFRLCWTVMPSAFGPLPSTLVYEWDGQIFQQMA
jgi:hypothetical protein